MLVLLTPGAIGIFDPDGFLLDASAVLAGELRNSVAAPSASRS